jgi:hypothetical protein
MFAMYLNKSTTSLSWIVYSSHAMNFCIIQSSTKVILFSLVLTSKNSFVRDIY